MSFCILLLLEPYELQAGRLLPLLHRQILRAARQIFPAAHVGDALLIPLDHYFGALRYGRPIVRARAGNVAHALLREDHLASPAFADRNS